jgi:hypothetical protein
VNPSEAAVVCDIAAQQLMLSLDSLKGAAEAVATATKWKLDLENEIRGLRADLARVKGESARAKHELSLRLRQARHEIAEAHASVEDIAALLARELHTVEATDAAICPVGFYVYCLWNADGDVIYVGQSTNIFSRLGQHAKNPQKAAEITRVTLTRCPDQKSMDRIERALIVRMQPKLNIAGLSWRVYPPLTADELALASSEANCAV